LNEHEADLVGKMFGMQTADKTVFSQELNSTFNLVTVVTMGGDGSVVASNEGTYVVSPLKIKAIDAVGAGDAYTGYFCASLDQGKSLEDAFKAASVAGSLACTKVGAQTALPMRQEVDQYLAEIKITQIAPLVQKFA
jgi:ribokinase